MSVGIWRGAPVLDLDYAEDSADGQTAVERLKERLGAPVLSIAGLPEVIAYFHAQEADAPSESLNALLRHQALYCR